MGPGSHDADKQESKQYADINLKKKQKQIVLLLLIKRSQKKKFLYFYAKLRTLGWSQGMKKLQEDDINLKNYTIVALKLKTFIRIFIVYLSYFYVKI